MLWLLAGWAAAMPVWAEACAELESGYTIESERFRLSYRTLPERLTIGQHFVLEVAVCAKEGQPAPERIRVDATMPEHRHGMNYKPTVMPGSPGRFRAEGLLFHMSGRWQMLFEVTGGGKTDRLVHDHQV